jgi:small subunit ribosomal protein S20
MPVTKSAKKALRVSARRKEENLVTKDLYKKAVKLVRKAAEEGAGELSDLLGKAQSALDKASKRKAIHRNKAARLKSRLAKKVAAPAAASAPKKTGAKKKTVTKKKTSSKKK